MSEVVKEARFVNNRPREKRVDLEDHVEYGGKVYTSLTVRRMTAKEVSDWAEAVKASPDEEVPLGNVVDDEGNVVPQAVLDKLDVDDDEKLGVAVADFLPRKISRVSEEASETPTSS